MKILITGCAGFIGYHLTRRLLSEGHSVVGVDNMNGYYSPTLKMSRLEQLGIEFTTTSGCMPLSGGNGFTFFKSDITDKALFDEVLSKENFDAVCHLAAQAGVRYSIENPQEYITSNIQGFFNILEYCRIHPQMRLVFASSSSVYGKNTSIPYRETDMTDTPVSLYAATKKSNELMAHSYSELYGITAIGLRFFTVYGPWGRPDMAPFLFTKAILNDQSIQLFNYGNMSRDFTYIDDIVEGIHKVLLETPRFSLSASKRFRVYNIGNSKPVHLEEFVSTIESITGKTACKIHKPMQPGDVSATWADTSLMLQDYGYAPKTSIDEGLRQFIRWYTSYYNVEQKPKVIRHAM